jgi:hypothetical protein
MIFFCSKVFLKINIALWVCVLCFLAHEMHYFRHLIFCVIKDAKKSIELEKI